MNYYCKYCGFKSSNIGSLTASVCPRHPTDRIKGRHVLYEGTEKSKYECKYCGAKASTIAGLIVSVCPRHPTDQMKGRHEPAI